MSAPAADKPAEAERDSHPGIRQTFDSVAQKLFQRRSVLLQRTAVAGLGGDAACDEAGPRRIRSLC